MLGLNQIVYFNKKPKTAKHGIFKLTQSTQRGSFKPSYRKTSFSYKSPVTDAAQVR